MDVRIEKPKSYVREMHISVPYEQYANEKERITRSYQTAAEIPGFRKGKAPIAMVASSFRGEIEKEAREHIVRDAFSRAVREHRLFPITHAEITDFTASEENGQVSFSAHFQVIPEFTLSLEGISTSFEPAPVDDDAVMGVIEELRDKFTTVKPVPRASRSGDTIEFDYVAYDGSGEEVDSAQGMTVDCKAGESEGTLASQLLGVKPGEKKACAMPYPATFPAMELHGADVRIKVDIKEVKEKAIPEINDELAKTVGMESLAELKNSIRKQLEHEQEMIARNQARERMVEALILQNDFEVPDALLSHYGELPNEEREKALSIAEKKARLNIILDKVAEVRELKVPDEEIAGFLEKEAERESVDPQRLRSYLVQTGKMADIIAMFKREKAFSELERQYVKKK